MWSFSDFQYGFRSSRSTADLLTVVSDRIARAIFELSYILAELFNNCLKESCFPDSWKVSSVVPVLNNVGERSAAKNYCPVSLLSVGSKAFKKLVNDRIVDHLEKCGLFSDFQYGFRSSRSTADLLTVESDRVARAFNRCGLLELWHLIYPRLLTGFGMLAFFTK